MTTTIFDRARATNHWIVTTACTLLLVNGAALAADYPAFRGRCRRRADTPVSPET